MFLLRSDTAAESLFTSQWFGVLGLPGVLVFVPLVVVLVGVLVSVLGVSGKLVGVVVIVRVVRGVLDCPRERIVGAPCSASFSVLRCFAFTLRRTPASFGRSCQQSQGRPGVDSQPEQDRLLGPCRFGYGRVLGTTHTEERVTMAASVSHIDFLVIIILLMTSLIAGTSPNVSIFILSPALIASL